MTQASLPRFFCEKTVVFWQDTGTKATCQPAFFCVNINLGLGARKIIIDQLALKPLT